MIVQDGTEPVAQRQDGVANPIGRHAAIESATSSHDPDLDSGIMKKQHESQQKSEHAMHAVEVSASVVVVSQLGQPCSIPTMPRCSSSKKKEKGCSGLDGEHWNEPDPDAAQTRKYRRKRKLEGGSEPNAKRRQHLSDPDLDETPPVGESATSGDEPDMVIGRHEPQEESDHRVHDVEKSVRVVDHATPAPLQRSMSTGQRRSSLLEWLRSTG